MFCPSGDTHVGEFWRQWASYRRSKLRVAHTLAMPVTFSPSLTSNETASKRSRHAPRHVRHARAVMHVGIANPRWPGKRSRHSRRMRNPQFCVSCKRPITKSVTYYSRKWARQLDPLQGVPNIITRNGLINSFKLRINISLFMILLS